MTKQLSLCAVYVALAFAWFLTGNASVLAHLIHDNYQQQPETYQLQFVENSTRETSNKTWVITIIISFIVVSLSLIHI